MKEITFAIVGLGSRGKDTYAPAIHSMEGKARLVAVADIDPAKVVAAQKQYGIEEAYCFPSAEAMLDAGKLADAMVIATQDRQHVRQAIKAMRLGYDLILEKPISPSLSECREIVEVSRETGRKVVVCHVLRYTPFYSKLKQLLDSGAIGQVVSIVAVENVGYWHQAHSFVRGNWRRSDETSPMILQKSCHDMDLYLWLANKRGESVSSFGSTYQFKKEKAPAGAAARCLNGCKAKKDCPFDAEKIYISSPTSGIANGKAGWPNSVLALSPTVESITKALETGPYGRCVYHCDNNVVDHQVVNLQMEDGSTLSFTMCGFNSEKSRWAQFMGTEGEIFADMSANTLAIHRFGEEASVIDVSTLATDFSGHGGGDVRLVREFLDYLQGGAPSVAITTLERSVESHYAAMAAEESRLDGGRVVRLDTYRGVEGAT